MHFCMEDGVAFNKNMVGLRGVLFCLEELTGRAASRHALAELKVLLGDEPAAGDLAAWAQKTFPTQS